MSFFEQFSNAQLLASFDRIASPAPAAPVVGKFDVKAAVIDLLLVEADALLEGDTPDVLYQHCAELSPATELLKDITRERFAAKVHEAVRLRIARALYRRYLRAALRFQLSLLGEDLQQWANRWLLAAREASTVRERRNNAEFARVFVYLTVRDAVEWERDQHETVTIDDLVTDSFGDARDDGEFDGGADVSLQYVYDESGEIVNSLEVVKDHRPVNTVGEFYKFLAVA